MTKILKKIDLFLFPMISQAHLELVRVFFFGCLLILNFQFIEPTIYSSLPIQYWNPSGLFKLLPFLAPPQDLIPFFLTLWKLSLFMCMLGFLTKIFKCITGITILIAAGYTSNFYLYPVEQALLSLTVPLFIMTNIGERFSLDAFIFKQKTNELTQAWPLRFIQLVVVTFWFGSAIQKIRLSGMDWITSNHLEFSLGKFAFPASDYFMRFSSATVLLAELLSPLTLFKNWNSNLILFILFLFHLLSIIFIQIPIYYCLLVFIFWFIQYKNPVSE
jgi:hypothetical protein